MPCWRSPFIFYRRTGSTTSKRVHVDDFCGIPQVFLFRIRQRLESVLFCFLSEVLPGRWSLRKVRSHRPIGRPSAVFLCWVHVDGHWSSNHLLVSLLSEQNVNRVYIDLP